MCVNVLLFVRDLLDRLNGTTIEHFRSYLTDKKVKPNMFEQLL